MRIIDKSNPDYWMVGKEIKFKEVPVIDYICYALAGVVMAINVYILIKVAL